MPVSATSVAGTVRYRLMAPSLKSRTGEEVFDRASDLDSRLASYDHAPEVGDLIRGGLGVPGPVVAGEVVVRAFYIVPGEEVFSFYALTTGAFHIAEMNTAGTVLRISVPIGRMRRVVETASDDGFSLLIEIDADVVRGSGSTESRSGGVQEESFDRGGLSRWSFVCAPSVYELRADWESQSLSDLQLFATALHSAFALG